MLLLDMAQDFTQWKPFNFGVLKLMLVHCLSRLLLCMSVCPPSSMCPSNFSILFMLKQMLQQMLNEISKTDAGFKKKRNELYI